MFHRRLRSPHVHEYAAIIVARNDCMRLQLHAITALHVYSHTYLTCSCKHGHHFHFGLLPGCGSHPQLHHARCCVRAILVPNATLRPACSWNEFLLLPNWLLRTGILSRDERNSGTVHLVTGRKDTSAKETYYNASRTKL